MKSARHKIEMVWEIEEGVEVPITVSVRVGKYFPAVHYLNNGDPGYPAEGGEIEEIEVFNEKGTPLPQDIIDRLADNENFMEALYINLEDVE